MTQVLTALGDRIYGEMREDGTVAKVYGDPDLAAKMAAVEDYSSRRKLL